MCMQHACILQAHLSKEAVESCIWLIWLSDSDLFAHFSIFFTCFILPPLSHCARSDLYFFLHQNCFYHEIGKIKSHLCLKKNLHVALLKFQVTETQKWCYFFIAKEEVLIRVFFARWEPNSSPKFYLTQVDFSV